jgi:hypothetical protein
MWERKRLTYEIPISAAISIKFRRLKHPPRWERSTRHRYVARIVESRVDTAEAIGNAENGW